VKLAVTGKGGVGKTTLTALLANRHAEQGNTVLAIDADSSPCLGAALGFDEDALAHLIPIAEMADLICERAGAQPGTTGGYFKLNARVDDKAPSAADRAFIEQLAGGLPVLGHLPYTAEAQTADRAGRTALEAVPELVAAARPIATALAQLADTRAAA